jgi:hypothetical protein
MEDQQDSLPDSSDLSSPSICGAGKFGYGDSTRFAPQVRSSQRQHYGTQKHTLHPEMK